MKKKPVLAISSLLLSIGLLVGCSEEPEFEEYHMKKVNSEQNEMEFEPPVNEGDIDEEMNQDMDENMNQDEEKNIE